MGLPQLNLMCHGLPLLEWKKKSTRLLALILGTMAGTLSVRGMQCMIPALAPGSKLSWLWLCSYRGSKPDRQLRIPVPAVYDPHMHIHGLVPGSSGRVVYAARRKLLDVLVRGQIEGSGPSKKTSVCFHKESPAWDETLTLYVQFRATTLALVQFTRIVSFTPC